MSFCPHCGKSVAEQAVKCLACGGELQPRGKGVRFKGTMMMQPGQAPAATPVAPAPEPAVATPASAPKPAPVAAAEPARVAPAAPSKAKHTMIGTGGLAGLGIAPPPGVKSAVASVPPGAPPPAAGPSSLPPAAPPAADPLADTGRNPATIPPDSIPPAAALRQTPRLPSTPNFNLDHESDAGPALVPGRRGGPIIAMLLGGVMLLLVIAYFIARFLGLAS
jgi:hypothetical protein